MIYPLSYLPQSRPTRIPEITGKLLFFHHLTVVLKEPHPFDLTASKGRARIVERRDNPQGKLRLPPSAGDADAYWIKKTYATAHGVRTEVTLGYETGLFSQRSARLVTGVCVRRRGQENKEQFTTWVDQYARDWGLGRGELRVSTDREFWTGEILRQGEAQGWRLWIPEKTSPPTKGQLDQRYFTYLAAEDVYVCHEGVELGRTSYEAKKKRTNYQAPAAACAACRTAKLCKGGKAPRKISRSDFVAEFARGRQRQATAEFQAVRRTHRAVAEGNFAQSNGQHGLDRARYVGQPQMLLQAYLTAIVMNLRKACRWAAVRRAPAPASVGGAPPGG